MIYHMHMSVGEMMDMLRELGNNDIWVRNLTIDKAHPCAAMRFVEDPTTKLNAAVLHARLESEMANVSLACARHGAIIVGTQDPYSLACHIRTPDDPFGAVLVGIEGESGQFIGTTYEGPG